MILKRLPVMALFALTLFPPQSASAEPARNVAGAGGVSVVLPATTIDPGFIPANDPYPPMKALRTPTVGVNDNFANGIGKSAGALSGELQAAMSVEEAGARTRAYIKGVSDVVETAGSTAAGSRYLGRLAGVAQRVPGLGGAMKVLNIGALIYSIYDFVNGLFHSQQVAKDGEVPAGSAAWTSLLQKGVAYPIGSVATEGSIPGRDFPIGRSFITFGGGKPEDIPNQTGIYIVFVAPTTRHVYETYPIEGHQDDPADIRTVHRDSGNSFVASDGNWYSVTYRYFPNYLTGWGGIWRRATADQTSGFYNWVIFDPQQNLSLPDVNGTPLYGQKLNTADGVPPGSEDARVDPAAIAPLIQAGLDKAGIDLPESTRNKLAATAAAAMKGSDLNAVPDNATWQNTDQSPAGQYIPDQALNTPTGSNPSTGSDQGSNPDTGNSSNENSSSSDEIQVKGAPSTISLPTLSISTFEMDPGTCPVPKLGADQFPDPNVHDGLRSFGYPETLNFDQMCKTMDDIAVWFRPMCLVFISMGCFFIFRGK